MRQIAIIELAERVGPFASVFTRLPNPMNQNGLVKKETNPRDARVHLANLSRAVGLLLTDANISIEGSAKKFLEPLSATKDDWLNSPINALQVQPH